MSIDSFSRRTEARARLHEVGMVKPSPQKLIAQGTDWRFWNEVRRESKA